jgi:hypothetical protein|tara:strand:- start:71 stop:277 length:207 start_codon:yes stop_codon:yes gene_type:complete
MSNPIKHVRETGEYVNITPIASDNETLLYWKRVYEEKCREVARLDMEINDLKWDIEFLKDQQRQQREK